MRYIITDRFASIYATQLPGFRDGVSSPVCFNRRTGRYMAFVVSRFATHGIVPRERPTLGDGPVLTMTAGQRADYFPAAIS